MIERPLYPLAAAEVVRALTAVVGLFSDECARIARFDEDMARRARRRIGTHLVG